MRPKVKTTQKLNQKLKLKNHPLKDSKLKLKPNTKLKLKLKNQPLKTQVEAKKPPAEGPEIADEPKNNLIQLSEI